MANSAEAITDHETEFAESLIESLPGVRSADVNRTRDRAGQTPDRKEGSVLKVGVPTVIGPMEGDRRRVDQILGDREKALQAECSGYIEKPIDPVKFVAEMEGVLPMSPKGNP